MITIYPLEWIDSLILQTLNPKKTNISDLSKNDLIFIADNLSKESHKIQIQLKNEIFALQKKRQIRLLVRKYHSTFIYLLDKMIEHQKNKVLKSGTWPSVMNAILGTLDDLISFLESRYYNYLNLDERVPIPYLIVSRKEIRLKLDSLKRKKVNNVADSHVINIVIASLSNSIDDNEGDKITYRGIFYQKEILKQLDALLFTDDKLSLFSAVDQVLIELNFNDQNYINHLIAQIEVQINSKENVAERISELLLYYKEFGQLLSNEKITLNPSKQNIRYVLENWFKHEIGYLEKKIGLNADNDGNETYEQTFDLADNKVQCILSTDQMGLILRAGDEARILKAKSMNQVFRAIVPFLSTRRKKDLSYDSMRSKSYSAEERDKEIAIKTLEQIIKHIREF